MKLANLSKNEKEVLKLLLKNARISDSSIAKKLKISSQAVGKIRKKLETSLINSYQPKINISKTGLNIFAISLSKLTIEGLNKGELELEKLILEEPNLVQAYRLPKGSVTHFFIYCFKSIEEFDHFFSSFQRNKLLRYFENMQLFTFSIHSLIKSDFNQLIYKLLEEDKKIKRDNFEEIKIFKKKLK